jgi:hypothetical protein
MQFRFVTLAIPHRHGDLQPAEVGYAVPVARGEIQLNASVWFVGPCPTATYWSACRGRTRTR